MKKILIGLLSGVLMVMLGVGSPMVYAENSETNDDLICDSLESEELKAAAGCGTKGTVPDVLSVAINVVISVMGIAAVVVIMYGGFLLLTSTGDAAKVTKGRRVIIYAVVGLVVAILAYVIVNFISSATAPITSSGQTAVIMYNSDVV